MEFFYLFCGAALAAAVQQMRIVLLQTQLGRTQGERDKFETWWRAETKARKYLETRLKELSWLIRPGGVQ